MRESGFIGQLVSLSGVLGMPGLGRDLEARTNTISSAVTGEVAGNNNRRIALLVSNVGGNDAYIHFENPLVHWFTLKPGGVFQIDTNFPWVGPVYATGSSVTSTRLEVFEVSIP